MAMQRNCIILNYNNMEWTTIIVALISSIGASAGITSLVTMKEKKKEKQLENKEKEEEVKEKSDAR